MTNTRAKLRALAGRAERKFGYPFIIEATTRNFIDRDGIEQTETLRGSVYFYIQTLGDLQQFVDFANISHGYDYVARDAHREQNFVQ